MIYTARHAIGKPVRGQALAAHDGFSARYDLDRARGVASAWMLHEMASRGVVPLALVLNSVNPILVQGAAFGDVTMLVGFDGDITAQVPSGATVELDPGARTLRVL